jgi:TPR repeat protein
MEGFDESPYINGLLYYLAVSRSLLTRNAKPPSLGGWACGQDNPWVALAAYEYELATSRRLFLSKARWLLSTALKNDDFFFGNRHLHKRLVFYHAVEDFKFNGAWNDDIELGLLTGVKADADLAVSVMLTAGRGGYFNKSFTRSTKLGYRAMAFMIVNAKDGAVFSGNNVFENYICAHNSREEAYRFGRMAHGMGFAEAGIYWLRSAATEGYQPAQVLLSEALKEAGDKTESLAWLTEHAKSNEESKVKLFYEYTGDDEQKMTQQAIELAADLHKRHGDIAYWLGNYYFWKGMRKEAVPVLTVANELGSKEAAHLLAHCYIHGYEVRPDFRIAASMLSGVTQNVYGVALYAFCAAYGYGMKPSSAMARYKLSNFAGMTGLHGLQLYMEGFMLPAGFKQNKKIKKFWDKLWQHHQANGGIGFINSGFGRECFKEFIEFCGYYYAARWCRIKIKQWNDPLRLFASSVNNGYEPAVVFTKVLQENAEDADKAPMPGFTRRFKAMFDEELRSCQYNQAAEFLSVTLERCVERVYLSYEANPDNYTSLRLAVPWMDELCEAIQGMKHYKEAMQYKAKNDAWLMTKELRNSFNRGDSRAAIALYNAEGNKHSDEAVQYLDTALTSNAPEAFIERAYVYENKNKNLTGALDLYRKAIYKRHPLAVGNALNLLTNLMPQNAKTNAKLISVKKLIANMEME